MSVDAGNEPGHEPGRELSHALDKRRVRESFSRAADTYDDAAVLQREIGARMLERLEYIKHQPKRILDLGAGTGHEARKLAEYYRGARVIAMDMAWPMLRRARWGRLPWRRPRPLCGDMEAIPLADESVDMVFSNLALQWCLDPSRAFGEMRRVLRPGGFILFSSFGPDTLKELRASWGEVDGLTHVNRFQDMHDVGDAMMHAGLAEPVMDSERLTLTYSKAIDLMRDLKHIGAHNANAGRARGLTGKGRLSALIKAYENYRVDGRLPATYEVIYGHAWKGEAPKRAGVQIGLESLQR